MLDALIWHLSFLTECPNQADRYLRIFSLIAATVESHLIASYIVKSRHLMPKHNFNFFFFIIPARASSFLVMGQHSETYIESYVAVKRSITQQVFLCVIKGPENFRILDHGPLFWFARWRSFGPLLHYLKFAIFCSGLSAFIVQSVCGSNSMFFGLFEIWPPGRTTAVGFSAGERHLSVFNYSLFGAPRNLSLACRKF